MPRAILALALLLQVVIGLYGIAQPLSWGHQGFHVAEHGLAARNLARHGTWIPTRHSDPTPPPDSALSYHHPFLLHPYVTTVQAALGEEPWTSRAIPLAFSLAAILALFAFTRRVRGPTHAAIAALAFAATPLNLVFSHLPDHQIIAVAYLFISLCGLHALLTTASLRGTRVWLIFALLTGLTDWPWYPTAFLLFIALALATLRGHLGPDKRRLAGLLAIFAAIVLFSFAQHFAGVWLHDGLADLRTAFVHRGSANDLTEFLSVASRRVRELHTWPLFAVLVLWVPFAAYRALTLRRFDLGTTAILAITLGQTLHLARFPTEFMVHEYRSYWYVAPAAFALADITVALGRFAATRLAHPRLAPATALALAALALIPSAVSARQLLPTAAARAGSIYHPNYKPHRDLLYAARLVNQLTAQPSTTVALGGGLPVRTEFLWLLDRQTLTFWHASDVLAAELPDRQVWMIESTAALERNPDWRPLLARSRTLILGPYAIVELLPRGALQPATVESAALIEPPAYGAVDRWLHAPARGPTLIQPTTTRAARRFITATTLGDAVLRAYESGLRPLQARLPPELRAPTAAPPEAPAPVPPPPAARVKLPKDRRTLPLPPALATPPAPAPAAANPEGVTP
jgi:hypothetical protein